MDEGSATIDAMSINNASQFKMTSLVQSTKQSSTGIFMGMAMWTLEGSFTWSGSPTGNNSLMLDDDDATEDQQAGFSPIFGPFNSTSITEVTDTPGLLVFSAQGFYTPATNNPQNLTYLASMDITFTQDSSGGPITVSGDLSTSLQAVPEPSSFMVVLTSLVIGGMVYGFRRRRATRLAAA
jgi:hypothetical protein